MSDTLSLIGIEVAGHHGVFDFERREGQRFLVDVTLGLDTSAAAQSDGLDQTVDYGVLATDIAGSVASDPVDLIETLAQRLADICLARPQVEWVTVTVHKPEAPITVPFADVAVTITRTRGGTGG